MKQNVFTNPLKIIQAFEIKDVLPAFREVQEEINKGFYAAGFIAYEASPAFNSSLKVKEGYTGPLLWFAVFHSRSATICSAEDRPYRIGDWLPDTKANEYKQAFEMIKDEIKLGNTYQVNYTFRLRSEFSGDAFAFYKQLKRSQQAGYSAYLDIGKMKILSASPELFFRLKGDKLITKPMKGTVKRGKTVKEDENFNKWLQQSAKNQAENVMIVDLLRNDLNLAAQNGSIAVDQLFEIEKYPTVWQMTSTIQAKVGNGTSLIDIFKALFPCGSITGAPKISTSEIISRTERSPRGVYCGAIGFITPDNEAIFNVPIRTVTIDTAAGEMEYGTGGGVTWDSELKGEYDEAFLKAKLLGESHPDFQLLESFKLENGKYEWFEHHLIRLQESADYFDFPYDGQEIKTALKEYADHYGKGIAKVRLTLARCGSLTISDSPLLLDGRKYTIKLAEEAIDQENPFLYHKTTNRKVYEQLRKAHPGYDEVLLWNQHEELTEFTNGNLVVKLNGKLYTPPVESGLLAGTFRKELLITKSIEERKILKSDLPYIEKIWFINSVRGWVEGQLCE
ncbi:aminodeoxychorismate synthase component I [Bacillus massiliglaciei]|uniref:aminodeoxychorismate synthase component I n=1 Tax=Bacillus massiliglaciei TaxID=1816693 RepID=UPI000B207A04|nr:aminodeoxychorismate synthase component I [Bacillus massiliglaciei]